MGSPEQRADALVLDRKPSGESRQLLTLHSPQLGLVHVLQRLSRSGSAPGIDLFDLLRVRLSHPRSGSQSLYFLAEVEILKRHQALGRHYGSLQAAAAYGRLLIRNASHLEDHERIHARACEFLEALERQPLPHTALLKAVYRFLAEEGYAVRQDWRERLPEAQRSVTENLLKTPLSDMSADSPEAEALLTSLKAWSARHTDVIFD